MEVRGRTAVQIVQLIIETVSVVTDEPVRSGGLLFAVSSAVKCLFLQCNTLRAFGHARVRKHCAPPSVHHGNARPQDGNLDFSLNLGTQ